MPERERVLLLLLAHASNELTVLRKLILMMRKDQPPSAIVDHVEGGQTFILMRLLIGKLHGRGSCIRTEFRATARLPRPISPALDTTHRLPCKRLTATSVGGSALTAIRNNISFHYTDKQNLTEINFQQLAKTEPLLFYLARTTGNSFFHAGELVAQLSAINQMRVPATDPNDNRPTELRAFNALCDEIITVSASITELFAEFIGILGEGVVGQVTIEQIPNGPKLSTFSLPYFFDENDTLAGPARKPGN